MASKWLKKISGWIQDPLALFREKPARKKSTPKFVKKIPLTSKKKSNSRKTSEVGGDSKKKKKPPASKKIKHKKAAALKKSVKRKPLSKKAPGAGRPLLAPGARMVSKKPVAPKVSGVLVGEITHYFSKAGACAIRIEKAELKEGASIRIRGNVTDFKMTVKSIQINRIPVPSGRPGEDVGIGVSKPVEVGDSVFLV